MERALELSKEDWVAERMGQASVTQLLAIRGIQMAHIKSLQNAGIENLHQLRQATRWPLMGATNDWVRDWLDAFVADLNQEYAQLRRVASRAA